MPRLMPTTLRLRCRAQARGGSLLHHVPNRPPRFPTSTPPPGPSAHPSGFSIRSQQDSVSFNPAAHQRLPFVPPSPRSSIPESKYMRPLTLAHRLLEKPRGKSAAASFSRVERPGRRIIYSVSSIEESGLLPILFAHQNKSTLLLRFLFLLSLITFEFLKMM